MKVSESLLASCFIFLLLSCNYIPCGWDSDLKVDKGIHTTKELVGVYRPDAITTRNISGFKLAEIILDSTSNLVFKKIPVDVLDFEQKIKGNHSLIDGTGTWNIGSKSQTPELNVDLRFRGHEAGYITSYRLYSKDGKNVIFMIVGDPDECSAARFVQQDYSR